jgi:hypothetical protein
LKQWGKQAGCHDFCGSERQTSPMPPIAPDRKYQPESSRWIEATVPLSVELAPISAAQTRGASSAPATEQDAASMNCRRDKSDKYASFRRVGNSLLLRFSVAFTEGVVIRISCGPLKILGAESTH